ncbi:uncharacterized protein [Temnothorax nylanderi]|uniref:uncharacterized protein n=1 Tax=Temnothorax nylanderi TaxID=102681 RepID=UPI003A86A6B0
MSSSGEFSTLSSGEATGTGEDSLPSSREATAEAAGSGGGFVPLREFLDRFSLPRVVRVEGAGGRPILLYKQQQRSLRVTATLLMHRYRHDVKVGPEIVIPEGYPDIDFAPSEVTDRAAPSQEGNAATHEENIISVADVSE